MASVMRTIRFMPLRPTHRLFFRNTRHFCSDAPKTERRRSAADVTLRHSAGSVRRLRPSLRTDSAGLSLQYIRIMRISRRFRVNLQPCSGFYFNAQNDPPLPLPPPFPIFSQIACVILISLQSEFVLTLL